MVHVFILQNSLYLQPQHQINLVDILSLQLVTEFAVSITM